MRFPPSRKFVRAVGLLWLSGTALRLTILAVPPVLPLIRADLHLSATAVGLLVSLPVALFTLAALPGSLLIARFGTLPTLIGGLLLVALGAGLRGASPNVAVLFLTTIFMGFGVAVLQPTMPAIVRQWLPEHIGFGTATYINGLIIAELVPPVVTIPFVLPFFHGNWRMCLAVWSIPVALIALIVGILAPRSAKDRVSSLAANRQWWPDWKNRLIWRLGILFGSINAIYFATNAFLPVYLNTAGRPDLITAALTSLNFGQLLASYLLLAVAGRLERRAWPYAVAGLIMLVSVVGLVFMIGTWTIIWAGLLSFGCGAGLALGLMLPPLLSPPEDVARTSAAMFTVSYAGAVVTATICGAVWDVSGIPGLAFAPIGLCAITLAASALLLRSARHLR